MTGRPHQSMVRTGMFPDDPGFEVADLKVPDDDTAVDKDVDDCLRSSQWTPCGAGDGEDDLARAESSPDSESRGARVSCCTDLGTSL